VEFVPKCRRIIQQLEHFFRRLHMVFVLRFIQCRAFAALVHCETARIVPATLILKTDGTETLSKPISVFMKDVDMFHEKKTLTQSKRRVRQPWENSPKPQ
jgi:hypothetical protein